MNGINPLRGVFKTCQNAQNAKWLISSWVPLMDFFFVRQSKLLPNLVHLVKIGCPLKKNVTGGAIEPQSLTISMRR